MYKHNMFKSSINLCCFSVFFWTYSLMCLGKWNVVIKKQFSEILIFRTLFFSSCKIIKSILWNCFSLTRFHYYFDYFFAYMQMLVYCFHGLDAFYMVMVAQLYTNIHYTNTESVVIIYFQQIQSVGVFPTICLMSEE